MKKCKNIECKIEIDEKRVYCSLKCRNIYVNKYLRDYSKCSQTLIQKNKQYYIQHNCLECGEKIPYEKRANEKFCSSSCSASFNNKGRHDSEITKEKKRVAKLKYDLLNNKNVLRVEKCKNCDKEYSIKYSTGKKYCSKECKNFYQRQNLNEYQKYRLDAKFKFNVFDYSDEFDISLIEKYGFYKAKNRGDNPNGISRDHMYSIKDGFDYCVDVNLISHPANCRLIHQMDNAVKQRKSIITIDELKERIEIWKIKYEKNS